MLSSPEPGSAPRRTSGALLPPPLTSAPAPSPRPTADRHARLAAATLSLAVVATGLSAGFFYGWQVGAVPGLGVVDDSTYILAMNGVNAEIRNAGFGAILFGSIAAMSLALLSLARRWREPVFLWTVAALVVYLVGLIGTTLVVHVPMNRELLEIADPSRVDAAAVRAVYETRWNAWHLIRSATAVLSFALLVAALCAAPRRPT